VHAELGVGEPERARDGPAIVGEPQRVGPQIREQPQVETGVAPVAIEHRVVETVLAAELPRHLAGARADLHHRGQRGLLEPAREELVVGGGVFVPAGVGAVEREPARSQAQPCDDRRRQAADAGEALAVLFHHLPVAREGGVEIARPDDRPVLLVAVHAAAAQ
jgi:hypothetical protein